MKRKITFLLIVIGSFFSQSLNATTYYADPVNGSMANVGSSDEPWSSLATIILYNTSFEAGDTILLRDGGHGTVSINSENTDFVYVLPDIGHQPIIKQISFGSTLITAFWQIENVIIESIDTNVSPGFLIKILDKATYINIINCTIQSSPDTENWSRTQWRNNTNHGIEIFGEHCLIENNELKNIQLGMSIKGEYVDIIGNTVENFAIDGIRILSSNCLYEKNTIFNNIIVFSYAENHNDGFQSFTCCPVGTDTIENVTVRQNLILNTDDEDRQWWGPMQGFGAFDGYFKNWVIENNIVITDHWHGITLLGAIDCHIINNTVIDPYDISAVDPEDPQSGGNVGPAWIKIGPHKNGSSSSGNIIRNNLTADLQTEGSGAVIDHNITIGASSNYEEYFKDIANFDVALKADSPGVDMGSEELAPFEDFIGTLRPQGDGIDIGAMEYDLVQATEEAALPSIAIFPNPASTYIELENTELQPESIWIFNAQGQMVRIIKSGNFSRIDISNFSNGIYLMLITSRKGTFKSVFVKS